MAVLSCNPSSHLPAHSALMSGHFLSCSPHLRARLWQKLHCVVLHVLLVPLHPHFLHLSPASQVPVVSPGHREACDEPIWSPGRRRDKTYFNVLILTHSILIRKQTRVQGNYSSVIVMWLLCSVRSRIKSQNLITSHLLNLV